jgi:hypothetical protein
MIRSTVVLCLCLCVCACKKGDDKKENPASKSQPSGAAAALLDRAIEAAGGLEKLKAASSFTCKSNVTMLGVPVDAVTRYTAGKARLDFTSPLGSPVTRVESTESCWVTRGQAVVPCTPEMARHVANYQRLFRLSWLWPLKEEPGWRMKVGTAKQGGTERGALTIRKGDFEGTLLLDKQSHLVMGLELRATMMGMKGKFKGVFSEHEEHCGVKIATRQVYSFMGRVVVEEKASDFRCGPLDDKVFAAPEQVKDGTVVLKKLPATPAACLTHKGPYHALGPKMVQLFGFMMKNRAPAVGSPMMIYRVAPPFEKNPAKFETDICLRLAREPAKPPKGSPFVVRTLEETEVLAAYGIGEMLPKIAQLAGVLAVEVKKRRRKPAGPLRQIAHMSPKHFPPAKLLIELQLPLK